MILGRRNGSEISLENIRSPNFTELFSRERIISPKDVLIFLVMN
jgi:hypothetical protein